LVLSVAAAVPKGLPTFDFDVDNDSVDVDLRCFGEAVEAGTVDAVSVSGKVATDPGEGVEPADCCGDVVAELVSPEVVF